MIEAKHTPGPWVVTEEWSQPTGNCYSIERERESERAANLSLIAAAPELLAALKVAQREFTLLRSRGYLPHLEAIEAAIAKAEGRA